MEVKNKKINGLSVRITDGMICLLRMLSDLSF